MMNQWGPGPGYEYGSAWAGQWAPMVGGWEHPWLLAAFALAAPFIIAIVLWSLAWKGLALWHAARRGQYWWFLILLVVNTAGILEIIYLFFVAKLKWSELLSTHSHGHSH